MIASMTGFARREISGSWGALVCELRSVNHRFLDLTVKVRTQFQEHRQHVRRQSRVAGLQIDEAHRERRLVRSASPSS